VQFKIMPSISKTQVLTGSQVALTAASTNGLALINSTSANLSFVVNGGDTATLLAGQMLPLDVNNANKVTVSGTGTISYIINQ
jgi:hypothetical protein